jgi:hypothetical protein
MKVNRKMKKNNYNLITKTITICNHSKKQKAVFCLSVADISGRPEMSPCISGRPEMSPCISGRPEMSPCVA